MEELAGGQFEDLLAWERGVEVPVELVEWLQVSEQCKLGPTIELPLAVDGKFVLEDEFEELKVVEPAGLGFLDSDVEGLGESGESELPKVGTEWITH